MIEISSLRRAARVDPNDPAVVRGLQQAIADSTRRADAMTLLVETWNDPALREDSRGLLTLVLVDVLRRAPSTIDPATLGIDPSTPACRSIHRGLKHHLDAAVEEIELLRNLARGWSASDAPKFIIAIPKSGSSLLGTCLGNMIKVARGGTLDDQPFEFRGYPSWWKVGATHDWDLRPEIGADPLFRRYPGAVYKGHITPTPRNFATLAIYRQSRYLVVVRDPRDQIVAEYCQQRRHRKGRRQNGAIDRSQVHQEMLDFLQSGALLENLTFVGKWLAQRHRKRSLVVTYEDLVRDPVSVLTGVGAHFGLDLGVDDVRRVHDYASRLTDRVGGLDRSGHDPSIYPLGWTGRVGIWRDYFDASCTSWFEEAFRSFGRLGPWGEPIGSLYPDLDESSGSKKRTADPLESAAPDSWTMRSAA